MQFSTKNRIEILNVFETYSMMTFINIVIKLEHFYLNIILKKLYGGPAVVHPYITFLSHKIDKYIFYSSNVAVVSRKLSNKYRDQDR